MVPDGGPISVGTSAGTALTTAATSPHAAHLKLAAASPTRVPNLVGPVTRSYLPPSGAHRPTVAPLPSLTQRSNRLPQPTSLNERIDYLAH